MYVIRRSFLRYEPVMYMSDDLEDDRAVVLQEGSIAVVLDDRTFVIDKGSADRKPLTGRECRVIVDGIVGWINPQLLHKE